MSAMQLDPHRRCPHPGPTRMRQRRIERTCETGKFCYETKRQADLIAERMMEAGAVDPGCHVEAYPCPHCRGFHVGNRKIVFPKD